MMLGAVCTHHYRTEILRLETLHQELYVLPEDFVHPLPQEICQVYASSQQLHHIQRTTIFRM